MNIRNPVADMFSRIKNAQTMSKKLVNMPASKLKENIAKVLLSEGYIRDFQVEGEKNPTLTIYLKYYQNKPVIETLNRMRRVRVYRGVRDLPKVMGGLGIAIVSTPKGIVSDRVARSLGQGGEVLGLVT